MDFELIAADFLRALRGKRSQAAFCRRLGYKSNVAYTWESQRGFPSAARAFQIAQRLGIDVDGALRRFYVIAPPWLDDIDITTKEGVAKLLSDLQGKSAIVDLARYTGKTRFAISRWLKGESEPRLNEFFQLVECASLRLIDLLETLVDPKKMPSIYERWQKTNIARRLAYDAPWTQAVLRVLELAQYKEIVHPPAGWIAQRIGISPEEERRCIELLCQAGQVEKKHNKWRLIESTALDVRKDPDAMLRLRGWWGRVAAERSERGSRGTMYTLGGVSSADLERLREVEKAYFNEIRAIVSQSQPVEHVVLAMVQLLDLGDR